MQKMLQLDPPIPVITSRGKGFAYVLIDYGIDYDLLWVVGLSENGECWTLSNKDIRFDENITLGRIKGKI